MNIKENISLASVTTFGVKSMARYYVTFQQPDELPEIIDWGQRHPLFVLGGGSNILFTKNVDGLVIKNECTGIELLHEDSEYVYVRAGAGENWHSFVLYCISRNWAGIENLSLIPGSVGASPIQNIGAYGTELEEVFWDLEAYHIATGKRELFTHADCAFGYRESVFKRKFKNQFIILSVTFRLRKKPHFNIRYGAIEQELEKMGIRELSVKAISDAVCAIRSAKLPDPAVIGNAGSFFKNPIIAAEKYAILKQQFPGMVAYPNADGSYKLAAGWLIEHCGPEEGISWKGYRKGDAGCHASQALVLVNYGNATGKEIYELSEEILQSVKSSYTITLEREVNIY